MEIEEIRQKSIIPLCIGSILIFISFVLIYIQSCNSNVITNIGLIPKAYLLDRPFYELPFHMKYLPVFTFDLTDYYFSWLEDYIILLCMCFGTLQLTKGISYLCYDEIYHIEIKSYYIKLVIKKVKLCLKKHKQKNQKNHQ